MKKLVNVLKDFIKTIKLGVIISLVITIILGLISIIVNKGDMIKMLQVIKAALLIIGAFGFILVAILILKKKTEKPLEYIEEWRKKYEIFSYKLVLLLASLTILLCGGIIDWFLVYRLL